MRAATRERPTRGTWRQRLDRADKRAIEVVLARQERERRIGQLEQEIHVLRLEQDPAYAAQVAADAARARVARVKASYEQSQRVIAEQVRQELVAQRVRDHWL